MRDRVVSMCTEREDSYEERVWDGSAIEISESAVDEFHCFGLI